MTLLSPAALEQLNTPHHIYYSQMRLIFFTALLGGFAALFLLAGLKVFLTEGMSSRAAMGFTGMGTLFLLFMVFRTLPSWRGLGEPAVTISKEGLRFRGETLIPWSNIDENDWQATGVLGVTSAADVHLRVSGRRRKFQALFFKCDGDEYLHYCNLYEAASQQA